MSFVLGQREKIKYKVGLWILVLYRSVVNLLFLPLNWFGLLTSCIQRSSYYGCLLVQVVTPHSKKVRKKRYKICREHNYIGLSVN